MLSEGFITAIRAERKSANTAIAKDVGIYVHELHPSHVVKSSFKKSSTPVNALACTSTHIFAAQVGKAVVHVYSRERGNQEALISFPERVHSLALVGENVLVVGTGEGRIILWEVCTGRLISTPPAHLQLVACIAATPSHIITGSEDSNIHVWSVPRLLSLESTETHEPLRSLSNHRAAITSLAVGTSTSPTNICVSASKDNTIIVWNYHSGDLLRTFLLPSTPLCLALDPCHRAVYAGFEDGSLQLIEFIQPQSIVNPLYDTSLQTTPVQITLPPWIAPFEASATLCLGLSYDGTSLYSGHTSGKIAQWDTGRRAFASELLDLNAPVTNLLMLSPFAPKLMSRAITVVKPKLGETQYTFTAQLCGRMSTDEFDRTMQSQGFPEDKLSDAISRFYQPVAAAAAASSSGDEDLRKQNEELWKVVHEQQALQKKTLEKYAGLKSG
ncbi:WD repeat protein-like protein [Venustampulla echinocandica]|uniref:Pre-rRNA-processing protein IPI3 n=1 Tax=Venustampulla echinocandica TaxID=2656787 RepID=A0A370TK54_9HELO|nr:WD repeat protein-like protein [Venustampulla echinocandica]RDL35910.1 WD repeat protein-like protein [Venustampulla echinocandica]